MAASPRLGFPFGSRASPMHITSRRRDGKTEGMQVSRRPAIVR